MGDTALRNPEGSGGSELRAVPCTGATRTAAGFGAGAALVEEEV